ncbi:MAG: type 1 glutamine amidotransferase domain-containing protein [Bdellovibrio sp.]|nr:type 1 glutamine amidotransferase domain-containing protein [Bdellovibrio sp.]
MHKRKVLFVLTSASQLGDTGHKTGAYLSEITHAYEEFFRVGREVDMISPLGGAVPLDGVKMDDPVNAVWMNDEEFSSKLKTTLRPWQVQGSDYAGIYFVGGHGAMFDFPENLQLQKLAAEIYEQNGVVGSVCHGAAGIVNVRLSDGIHLVKDHEVSCFSNKEEETVGMEHALPFLLENRVQENGGKYSSASPFSEHFVKSGRLVTGQNPASAAGVAKAMLEVMDVIDTGRLVPAQNWCEWKGHESRAAGGPA